MANIFQTNCN